MPSPENDQRVTAVSSDTLMFRKPLVLTRVRVRGLGLRLGLGLG